MSDKSYEFKFVEHDNDGGPGTQTRYMLLPDAPERFIKAVVHALRDDPFITDIHVTVTTKSEQEMDFE